MGGGRKDRGRRGHFLIFRTDEMAKEGYLWALQTLCITPAHFYWLREVIIENYLDLVKVDTSKLPGLVASIIESGKAKKDVPTSPDRKKSMTWKEIGRGTSFRNK
jgi:hypothetical protein